MAFRSTHLPGVDEGNFHESEEVRSIRAADSPCCGSLYLQDV